MVRFRLTKRERKGSVIFLIFISGLLGLKFALFSPSNTSFSKDNIESIAKAVHIDESVSSSSKIIESTKKLNSRPLIDSLFDLNSIQSKELLSLGINEKEVSFFLKGREYKHGFTNFNQVDHVFGLKEETKNYLKRNGNINRVDLNLADAECLLRFKGVGKKLSDRIIKYRDKLGGFYDVNQLYEVYGLDSSVVDSMKSSIILFGNILKINVSQASLDEIISHPYFDYNIAMRIIRERSKVELKSLDFLSGEIGEIKIKKLGNYVEY